MNMAPTCCLCGKGEEEEGSDEEGMFMLGRLTTVSTNANTDHHVHTECMLFHACIAAAGGDQVPPEVIIRDNPELREKAISEALRTRCDHCGSLGASVEIECAQGSSSKTIRLHLPCAQERGHEIRGQGDGNYPKIVLPLLEDKVGDEAQDAHESGDDHTGGAQGAASRDVVESAEESPRQPFPSHSQPDSHGSAQGHEHDADHDMARSCAGRQDHESDSDVSAQGSPALGKRHREEEDGREEEDEDEDERGDENDDEVPDEDEGHHQAGAEEEENECVPVEYDELDGKMQQVYDIVKKQLEKAQGRRQE